MDPKDELLIEIKALIADSQKETVTEKALNEKVEAINKMIAEKLDNAGMAALKESVDNLLAATAANAAAIKAMSEVVKVQNERPKSFKDALIASVMDKATIDGLLTEKNDDYGKRFSLKEYFTDKGHQNSPVFVIKTELIESDMVQANVGTVRLTDLDPQRVGTPLTIYQHVTDWMPSKTITKPKMSVLVVYTYVDNAGTKTEGGASGASSFLLKTVEFASCYVATHFIISDETLDDLNEVMEEVASVAPSKILDKIDGYVLGTAGDDLTTIKGLLAASKKTNFASSTTYADTVHAATEVDAIAMMKLQCETNKYRPDTVLVGPLLLSKLGSKKDELNNSIQDRRVVYSLTGEPTAICGMQIKVTAAAGFATDACVVCDQKQFLLGKRKDMTMEIGYNAADLTEGQKTIVIKTRLAFAVRDPLAVIYASSLDTAVTDIDLV